MFEWGQQRSRPSAIVTAASCPAVQPRRHVRSSRREKEKEERPRENKPRGEESRARGKQKKKPRDEKQRARSEDTLSEQNAQRERRRTPRAPKSRASARAARRRCRRRRPPSSAAAPRRVARPTGGAQARRTTTSRDHRIQFTDDVCLIRMDDRVSGFDSVRSCRVGSCRIRKSRINRLARGTDSNERTSVFFTTRIERNGPGTVRRAERAKRRPRVLPARVVALRGVERGRELGRGGADRARDAQHAAQELHLSVRVRRAVSCVSSAARACALFGGSERACVVARARESVSWPDSRESRGLAPEWNGCPDRRATDSRGRGS